MSFLSNVGSGRSPTGPPRLGSKEDILLINSVAALTWLLYDSALVFSREMTCVWSSRRSMSKYMYLFIRYHSVVALSWFLMESTQATPFSPKLTRAAGTGSKPGPGPCLKNLKYLTAGRCYIGISELLTILVGEGLILLRINALYGWSRVLTLGTAFLFIAEGVVGLTTTIITLAGGTQSLSGSQNVGNCNAMTQMVPDINVGMWITSLVVACAIFSLILRKSSVFARETHRAESFPIMRLIKDPRLAPTIHLCLRDGAIYFLVAFAVLLMNLILTVRYKDFALLGTPWLIAVYSVASTRIFLNLKDLTTRARMINNMTWSEFQDNSEIEFRVNHELRRSAASSVVS